MGESWRFFRDLRSTRICVSHRGLDGRFVDVVVVKYRRIVVESVKESKLEVVFG